MNIPVCSWTALLVQIPDQRIRSVHVRYGRVKKVLRQTLGRCSNQEGVDPCVTNSETNTNHLTYNIYVKSLNELLNAHYYHLIKLCSSGWTAGFSVNGRFSLPSDIHRSIMYAYHREYLSIVNFRKIVLLRQYPLLKKTASFFNFLNILPSFSKMYKEIYLVFIRSLCIFVDILTVYYTFIHFL